MSDTPKPSSADQPRSGAEEINRRLLDERAESQKEIVEAANSASEIDRERPDSPERRERQHGVEDPSHSKGSTKPSS